MLKGDVASVSKVVRVAVSNNFNCTKAEFKQLDTYRAAHPNSLFFVNSNIYTKCLKNLNDNDYKAVITINPTLEITEEAFKRLYEIDRDKIAFVRVKYLPARTDICAAAHELAQDHYQVVITPQRFNGKKNLDIHSDRAYYKYSFNRYRLSNEAMTNVDALVDSHPYLHHCDRSGQGCSGCMNCAKLTCGSADVDIASLNLSSSGLCRFNCPDCYAKTMQNFLKECNQPLIKYDEIKKNKKQKGDTQHAKHALAKG